ncbi:hypothetical protein BDZ94DRAFT_1237536 [Collybia nuda]|uniref:Uncharacterized protein n=1 Tax=Collybia nuda TaxID=64659 RepID=A0A9P5Y3L3_9AGAR|nr:hypothetical protein BDZ94DRAFT_1237536 [Collybia nuda]
MDNHQSLSIIYGMQCQWVSTTQYKHDRNGPSPQMVPTLGNDLRFDTYTTQFTGFKTYKGDPRSITFILSPELDPILNCPLHMPGSPGTFSVQNIQATFFVARAPLTVGPALGPQYAAFGPLSLLIKPKPKARTNNGSKNEASHQEIIIGGSVGGLTFSILLCIILFLYCRKRRNRGGLGKGSVVKDSDQRTQGVCLEVTEVQSQREVLQLDLERYEYGTTESGNGLDSEVNRLRGQIEELTRRMEEFEIIRQDDPEAQAPPDYYSRSTPSPVDY